MVHEGSALQVLRTEVEPGSAFDLNALGSSPACHYVIEGNPVFESPGRSADLVPGDSIFFDHTRPYRVCNRAPSRSVILTVMVGNGEEPG